MERTNKQLNTDSNGAEEHSDPQWCGRGGGGEVEEGVEPEKELSAIIRFSFP